MSVNTKKLSSIGLPTKPRVPRAKKVEVPVHDSVYIDNTSGRMRAMPKAEPLPPKPPVPPPVDPWVEAEKEFLEYENALYEFRYYKRNGYSLAEACRTARSYVEQHKQQLAIRQHNKEILEKYKDYVPSLEDIKIILNGNARTGLDRFSPGNSLCVCCGAANPKAYSADAAPGGPLGGNRIWWQYLKEGVQAEAPVRPMEEYVTTSEGYKVVFNWEKE